MHCLNANSNFYFAITLAFVLFQSLLLSGKTTYKHGISNLHFSAAHVCFCQYIISYVYYIIFIYLHNMKSFVQGYWTDHLQVIYPTDVLFAQMRRDYDFKNGVKLPVIDGEEAIITLSWTFDIYVDLLNKKNHETILIVLVFCHVSLFVMSKCSVLIVLNFDCESYLG